MRNAMDAQEVAVGWWPGDPRYPRAAFYAYAHPAPAGFEQATLAPATARWDATLGEYILDWDDVIASPDPHQAALDFATSAARYACEACAWDPALVASLQGIRPPSPESAWSAEGCSSSLADCPIVPCAGSRSWRRR